MYSASPPSRPSPARAAGRSPLAEVLGPDGCSAGSGRSPTARRRATGSPDLEAVGARAERGHGAGDLVAERERQLVRQRPGRPVHEVQVGVAEAGAGDAHEHLTWTRFRHGTSTSSAGCSQAVSRIAFMREPYHMN